MTLLTILAASSAPVARADLMAQLRLDTTADADQLERLDQMISDAIAHLEAETGLTLAPTDFEQRLDCWPRTRRVLLGAAPVRGVDGLFYVDADGEEQEVDAADWRFVPTSSGGELWLASGFSAPSLADWPGSVRIRFAAGFNDPDATGSEADDRLALPGYAREGVIRLAAAWFLDRDGPEPPSVARMVALLRVYR